jgi:transcriptional regulator of heat shock response
MKVKTILVSQPEPKVDNSPYFELQQKHKVKIDFRPFIHVEGVNAKEIRLQKIDLNNPYLNNNIDSFENIINSNYQKESINLCDDEID